MGIIVALIVQGLSLSIITLRIDWQKEVIKLTTLRWKVTYNIILT
jgi:hypothetical protein